MSSLDLSLLTPGFDNEALGSQAVFRVALQALSQPGLPIEMPLFSGAPRHGHMAAAVLLLSLLDSDTSVWLSPALADTDAPQWLRFHTGCRLSEQPQGAHFCWLALGDAWPMLSELMQGSDDWPDRSATCVIEVDRLEGDSPGWQLKGPGIEAQRRMRVSGMRADFVQQWQLNHRQFPRGVDVFLASPTKIAGLPRTIELQTAQRN